MSSPLLILGSGSPRRKQLLEEIGLSFRVEVPDVDESVLAGESPDGYVTRVSRLKARTIVERVKETDAVVLTADTTVALAGNILGKPESKEHAIEMLLQLSGSTHTVFSGVSVNSAQSENSICVATEVRFRKLLPEEAEYYWSTGEPADKAGSYGLQGAGSAFVRSIRGSHSNVIGLPLPETVELLRMHGVKCFGLGKVERSD